MNAAPKSANARAAALSAAPAAAAAESDDQKVELKASLSDSAGHLSRLTHSAAGRKSHKLLSEKKGGDAINALHAQPCCLKPLFPPRRGLPSCPAHAILHPAIRFPIEFPSPRANPISPAPTHATSTFLTSNCTCLPASSVTTLPVSLHACVVCGLKCMDEGTNTKLTPRRVGSGRVRELWT